MPPCLERTIVEIIYLIELLMLENPIDNLFGLKTSDSIIERLKER